MLSCARCYYGPAVYGGTLRSNGFTKSLMLLLHIDGRARIMSDAKEASVHIPRRFPWGINQSHDPGFGDAEGDSPEESSRISKTV
jgi:hypothetical protein